MGSDLLWLSGLSGLSGLLLGIPASAGTATPSAPRPGASAATARTAFSAGVARPRATSWRRPRGLLLAARSSTRICSRWPTHVLVARRVVPTEKRNKY